MPLVKWNGKLSVGVSILDAEHKELVGLFNQISSAAANEAKESVRKSLAALIAHTAAHFKYEECLFAETNYPDADEHKKEHDELLWQILAVQKANLDGHITLSGEALQFIRKWLVNHIITYDRKFGLHINLVEVNAGEAKERASISTRSRTPAVFAETRSFGLREHSPQIRRL